MMNINLQKVLANPTNRLCVDCGTPKPMWASINIGCFMCIDCSGIHRGMGTHISQIRSINLDQWKDEHVNFMLDRGNDYVNKKYEGNLPANFKRPSHANSYKMKDFIINKYQHKKYYKDDSTVIESENHKLKKTSESLLDEFSVGKPEPSNKKRQDEFTLKNFNNTESQLDFLI